MTPVEVTAFALGYANRRDRRQKQRNRDLYNLAVLIGIVTLSKHPMSFEEAFSGQSARVEMTDDQMYETVRALNAMFGGDEVR